VLVTSVEAGSAAAREGVQTGWQILKIGSTDLAPVVAKLNESYATSTLRELVMCRAILARLDGKPGESVTVEFLDGANQRVAKSLTEGKPRGELSQFGYLYPMHVWFDSSKVGPGDIGYVKFNMFLDPAHVMNLFGEAVEAAKHAGLHHRPARKSGRYRRHGHGDGGWFIDQPDQRLGTLYMRDTTLKFVVNPRVYTFAGPLAF